MIYIKIYKTDIRGYYIDDFIQNVIYLKLGSLKKKSKQKASVA